MLLTRLILVCLLLPSLSSAADGKLTVTWLGMKLHGLAAVVETPSGKVFLIDTGNAKQAEGEDYSAGRDAVSPFLKERGYQEIDGIIISHPHADHFGGVDWLLNNWKVKQYLDHGYEGRGQTLSYSRLRGLAVQRGGVHKIVHFGDKLDWDPELTVEVLSPAKEFFDASSDAAQVPDPVLLNSNSVVLRLQHGKNVFIFPGDSLGPTFENHMKTAVLPEKLKATVLTANQHGNAPGVDFPKLVRPQFVVVSCLADYPANVGTPKPRSPGDFATEVYGALGAQVFVTGFHGNITAVSNGQTVTMSRQHERVKPKVE